MLFVEQDAPLIKAWIVRRLENNSDADADVLADYVLALLRHDGDVETIRKLFEEEIPDFLREDAAAFTNDVLQAVKYQSYLPGAPPAPPTAPTTRQAHFPPSAALAPVAPRPDAIPPSTALYHPSAPYSAPLAPSPFSQAGSRKRARSDRDEGDVEFILNGPPPYGQPYKQSRRGGGFGHRGGRYEDPYGPRNYRGTPSFPTSHGPLPYGAPLPFPPPPIDASSIIENIQILQSLLPPNVDLPSPVYPGTPTAPMQRGKRRCRDYDTKGYCSREYDPNNAALALPPFVVQQPPVGNNLDAPNFQLTPPANRRESKKPRRIKGRAPFAANGPSHDKTKRAIVVQNIPSENFTEDQVRGYFSQFGNIVEISMQNQNRLAMIRFDSWEAANAAWSSPKVIFDNRFVKVYWHKDESRDEALANGKPLIKKEMNGQGEETTPVGKSEASTESELDLDEFYRKQLEAQKVYETKMKKRQEIELERQELEERQRKLRERQIEAKRQLQEKLKANGITNGSPSPPASALNGSRDQKPSSQTEALRAQLAALEQEANQLGIDPDDNHDEASSWTLRGRGRGRGFRGRGMFAPRATRGAYGYRGRGGGVEARHAAYAAYSLDNRPKVVALSGVDFTTLENDEALRQYLFSVGEFKEVHTAPAVTHVTFKDRKTAEKFVFGVSASNSIHGIEGKIEPTWAKSAPQSAESTKIADGDIIMASTLDDEQAVKAKTEAGSDDANGALEEGEIDNTPDRDQGDMDYEAGEW
ncbi:hypothetical protein NUW58_g5446 [Xylaria curta]|uniref:Uncharacterized protein n=1 Tax=Xylaria curta TaxID=42375 RepID=A0ACC1P4J3_9PEZI|nr:hypothetical protein NUW58_g5446 [Xylaria curta]